MIKQLSIRLSNTQIEDLKITKSGESDGNSLGVSFSNFFNSEKPREFILQFSLIIPHKDGIVFDIKYNALFETSEDIDEEFKQSDFTKVNAPAIAYPFLRSYVATLLTLSGYDPLMLPTINFLENPELNETEIDLD